MKRILLLEDDRQVAFSWQTKLEELGYYVAHETRVEPAIAAIDTAPFDLVIIDILIRDREDRISDKGGFSLLSHIALNIKVRPKIIAVSGGDTKLHLLKHAEILRADRTLRKSVSAEELVQVTEELLR